MRFDIMTIQSSDANHYMLVIRRVILIVSITAAIITIVGYRTSPLRGVPILLLCISAAALSVVWLSFWGNVRFYPKRSMLSASWWEKFYDIKRQPKQVFLMGHSMSKTFKNKKQAAAFVEWCRSNLKTTMRILFLSPENTELAQLRNIGKGMKHSHAADPIDNLRNKILITIEELEKNVISQIEELQKKPLVRYATCDLPYSIMAVDDEMVVTLYGTEPEADEQPTFLIKGQNSHAYQSFKKEFERIWSRHSKVCSYEDPIIVQEKKNWNRYIGLRHYDSELPPPKQAIIFPTYRCNEKCPDCMFRKTRDYGEADEMDIETFRNIVDQLAAFRIERFEISGGGEPLEHAQANDLLNCLWDLQKRGDGKLGLLTNGLHLDNFDTKKVMEIFNDYIRLSRYQKLSEPGKEKYLSRWKENIAKLQECKRSYAHIQTAIGIKYLLCPSNSEQLVQIVQNDMQDNVLLNVDHIRLRADRHIDDGTIAKLEQQLYYVLRAADISHFEDRISLSLPHITYPRNFRCWISPMNVVIAPNAQVFVCCNYLGNEGDKCIGNLKEQGFLEIWRSERHRELRKKLVKTNCNNVEYCDCRFAEIQNVFETIALTAGVED